jgi:hypothetical protein
MPGGGDEAAAVKNGQSPPRSGAFLTAARTMAPTVSFGMQIAKQRRQLRWPSRLVSLLNRVIQTSGVPPAAITLDIFV